MNDYDDARIEDSAWWVCPSCGNLNSTTVDDMQCVKRRCAAQFDSSSFDWDTSDEQMMQIVDEMLADDAEYAFLDDTE